MGKSSRHKSENTFKFQRFSERIANINIDVIRQIKHHDDTPEEVSTYFWDALEKQTELNCTEHFCNFRKEISSKVKTMVQLVHHKVGPIIIQDMANFCLLRLLAQDAIITALKTHLLVPESMALQALMDLSVALARDLQSDFYPHFQEFFDILVQLLGTYTKDVEVLEQTFTCLSYLFKFQWKYLIKDMTTVYQYFSSLLSQKYKEYIRTFAAESFAFLMRKVKDHSSLFDILLKSLQDHPEKSEGLGQLLFEMIKGVKNQFHSISVKVFPLLLEKFGFHGNKTLLQLPWEDIEVTYKTLFVCMMRHGDIEHISPLLDMLWGALSRQFDQCKNVKGQKNQNTAGQAFVRFLKLAKCVVDFKNASLIVNPDKLAKMMLQFVEDKNLPEFVGEPLLNLVSSVLTRCCSKLDSHTTNRLVSSAFKSQYPVEVICGLCRRLFNIPVFEKDVLPYFLLFCDQNVTKDTVTRDKTLLLVTELLLHKSPLIQHGGELDSITTYMLDFGKKGKVPSLIESMIKDINTETDRHKLIKFWIAIVCLPHVRPLKVDALIPHVINFVTNQLSTPQKLDPEVCFVMMQAIVTLTLMDESLDLFSHISADLVLDCLILNSENINYLRFVDMYLSHAVGVNAVAVTTEDKFYRIFPYLEDNVMSPNSLMRVFTLRILTSFKLSGTDSETGNVLETCLCAEMCGATVHTYRDKLRFLRKLDYTEVQKFIPHEKLQQVPLRYLIGCLYINFKLLWQPLKELITSHAVGMSKDAFWVVFGKQLSLASENCRNPPVTLPSPADETEDDLEELFIDNYDKITDVDERPDYMNYRIHLWRAMHMFSEQCEPRSRIFVPLFFDFLKLEYYTKDMAPTQDISRKVCKESQPLKDIDQTDTVTDESQGCSVDTDQPAPTRRYRTRSSSIKEDSKHEDICTDSSKKKGTRQKHRPFTRSQGKVAIQESSSSDEEDSDSEEILEEKQKISKTIEEEGKLSQSDIKSTTDDGTVEDDNEVSHTDRSNDEQNSGGKGKKAISATLLVQLDLFGKFRNPTSVYRHAELRETYYQMLLHRNPAVQKAAFTCFVAYKDKYLVPYKDNFQRILDEKTFKNELDMFSIDNTNGVIDPAHRHDVLTILMRILYGRMYSKTGMGSAGRGSGARQSIVLRFLNGCREDELKIFIDQIFEHFLHYVSDNLFTKVKEIRSTVQLMKVISMKKAQSVLSSIELILKKLGHMVDSYLPCIIQIIVGLGTLSTVCLEQRDKIQPYAVNSMKTIRKMAFARLSEIFMDYERYKWKVTEIDGIFEGMIWRRLLNISTDSVTRPNAILNFFSELTEVHRYFPMLVKHHEDDIKCTPINEVMKLLCNPDVTGSVTSVILNMINNLLSDPDVEEYDLTPVPVSHMIQLKQDVPIGEGILQPYVNDVLRVLEKRMTSVLSKQNKQGEIMELDILSRISQFVTDPRPCKTLISLLLSVLQKTKSEKSQTDTLHSVQNLLKLVEDRTVFIPTVCRLFSSIDQKNSRLLLCQVFSMMCEGNTELQHLAKIIDKLNSFDKRRVDEPDYLKRLDGYKSANLLVKSMSRIDRNVCAALINNCLFVINRTEDMSMRDASTNCLVTIVIQFGQVDYDNTSYRTIIVESVLSEVKTGLQNKLETIRHEYVTLLISLIDTFGDLPPYSELKQLRDKDPEVDFYECIKHIQMHKRARCIQRLIRHLRKNKMTSKTLMTYFLPLITVYLTDNHKKHKGMQDAAIDAVGAICKQLPWKHYYFYLDQYIQQMSKRPESQKLIVRLIVSVLDGFHFDLSKSTFDMKLAPDMETQDKEGTSDKDMEEVADIPEVKIARDSDDETDTVEPPKLNETTESTDTDVVQTDKQTCSEELATKIHITITRKVVVQLRKILVKKTLTMDELFWSSLPGIPKKMKWPVKVVKWLPKPLVYCKCDDAYFNVSRDQLVPFSDDVNVIETFKNKGIGDGTAPLNGVSDDEMQPDIQTVDTYDEYEFQDEDSPEEETKRKSKSQNKGQEIGNILHIISSESHEPEKLHPLSTVIMGTTDDQHKVNKSKYPEDEEILRVPIALAIVKLLQHLPSGALERFLPGVLLKVCNFLRSKSIDIRTTARNTLIKIQKTLGTRYFPFILSELNGCLLNGYQRHVLCFTIHKLLADMSDSLQPGDIDVCLQSLLEILNEELFGDMAEEKDVQAITVKLMEAKTNTSYDSYKLIAKHITKSSLMNLIQPLKHILDSTHKTKITTKVQLVLNSIVKGLVVNKDLTLESLLVFVHGLVSQTLPLLAEKKENEGKTKKDVLLEKKADHSLLLQTETPRGGVKPKPVKKTNLHVLIEFGLELLQACHGKEKIKHKKFEHLQMLDPFVCQLRDCLYSKYSRVNTFTLRILCWFLLLDLPSLKESISSIADGIFILLRNHASPGTAKGDNVELLAMLFRVVNVLVRKVDYYDIKSERLVVLLTFCEEDLYDHTRQTTAFALLKSIMSRKVDLPQIHELMIKVQTMSITADAPIVRRQCRQVILKYVTDFPLGKRLKKHLEFYISQLSYEYDSGRESALEIMAAMFTSLPQEVLAQYASLFFIPMSANLVNDESAKCRKLTGRAIKTLLTNIDHNLRSNLFSFVMKWFTGTQLQNKLLAAQLCGLFVEVEGQKFEGRLSELLPVLELQLEPGQFQQNVDDSIEHTQDHTIFNTLNTLLKIVKECNFVLTDKKWTPTMNVIWDYTEHFLTYPHLWVELVSCQLFGLLFRATQPEHIIAEKYEGERPYLMIDTTNKLQKLAEDFISQFQSELMNKELADQVLKNMVYLGKCAKLLHGDTGQIVVEDNEQTNQSDGQTKKTSETVVFSLSWLVEKMMKEATSEVVNDRKNTTKRSSVFKWIAAVSLGAGETTLTPLLNTILPPLQREIDDDSSTQDVKLKNLAKEVVEMLKKAVGVDEFTEIYSRVQLERAEKKANRKRKLAQEAVVNPEAAARRKIKKQQSKKEAKKRKILEHRPFKQIKKKKIDHFDKQSLR